MIKVRNEPPLLVVTIDRPQRRNAVDAATAAALLEAFEAFAVADELRVGILTGAGGNFCAGADLLAIAEGDARSLAEEGPGPMGPTRLDLNKPVIAAVEGYCVAGGLELALWCDLRVAAEGAVFGVFNRRFGVPLIDLGSVRLPRLIGQSRALDLVLTGRPVAAREALEMGLVNRLVKRGGALNAALELARELSVYPQTAMRGDRASLLEQWGLDEAAAMRNELRHGLRALTEGEAVEGARRFAGGQGRHGKV